MPCDMLARVKILSLDPNIDAITNSFVFHSATASGNPGSYTNIENAIIAFYNTTPAGGTNPIRHYLSPVLDGGATHSTITWYNLNGNLDGTPHGAPVRQLAWTYGPSPGGGTPIPEGVAAVLSYRADYSADVEFAPSSRPRARDRSRCYLGPLHANALAANANNRATLAAQFITDATHALKALAASLSDGADTWHLSIWSRKNASTKLASECWMDDRPDYQRRRSDPSPETRVYLAVP